MPISPGPWHFETTGAVQLIDAAGDSVMWGEVTTGMDDDLPTAIVCPYPEDRRLIAAAPELVAALRKVTANLRSVILPDEQAASGVLDAEALLKRIDEGGG